MTEFTNIQWLFPTQIDYESWRIQKTDVPFAEGTIAYLNVLSSAIMHDPQSRLYPDVATFAFFCRRANLVKLQEAYKSNAIRLGRGMVFHIAPSNVPINFAYSLVSGLLAGNYNVVRISSKSFPQVDVVLRHMHELESEYPEVSKRIAIVRYEHDSNANAIFSADCAVRVIWGGDATIARIRECAIPARSFDICFADRYSTAVINSDKIITENLKPLAERFYNDTYLFDQNACSAPHLVVWTGKHVEEAKKRFWDAVQEVAEQKYQFQEVMAVDKLTALYKQSCAMQTCEEQTKNNLLRRVEITELPCDIDSFRCTGGYFTEYTAQTLDDIAPIVNTKYQTLAYFGFEHDELRDFVLRNRLTGIDRIVPFGETTTFSLTWDGMNLIERMSRIVDVL